MDAYESPKLVIFNFFFVLKKEGMEIKKGSSKVKKWVVLVRFIIQHGVCFPRMATIVLSA
jgi:hypothetical protein